MNDAGNVIDLASAAARRTLGARAISDHAGRVERVYSSIAEFMELRAEVLPDGDPDRVAIMQTARRLRRRRDQTG